MSIVGVAMAIAMLVSVTGLAVGMAAPVTGAGETNEYWIVPETNGDRSSLVAAGDPQFGDAHAVHEQLQEREGVEMSTPLLMEVLRVETESGATEYVLALGVVPDGGDGSVAGLSTQAMTPGDPAYGDGTDERAATSEVVLSDGAATRLEAGKGDNLTVSSGGTTRSFSVVDVDEGDGAVAGTAPIAMMQLSELQAITGAAEHDQADQFLVRMNSAGMADDLEGLYDESEVHSGAEMTTQQVLDSDLSLALSATAVLVSVIVGVLFITTTMIFEIIGDRSQLTTLHAMGIGLRSQLSLYALQTIIVTSVGGLLGGIIGLIGVRLLNVAAERFSSEGAVAIGHPLFLPYGIGAGLSIGLLTVPLLGLTLWRLDVGGERIRE